MHVQLANGIIMTKTSMLLGLGTWIAWNMADANLHRPKPSIPVTATSEATDVSGAVETEEGRGRKKGRHPET